MKWLTNMYDPRKEDAKHSDYLLYFMNETPEQARKYHEEWLNGKVIGRPKASDKYTVEQLEKMGMVGIYAPSKKTFRVTFKNRNFS